MSNTPFFSYDAVPYESKPYGATHPDHLATIAKLFGLQPPPVQDCRVLELGCASGGNLIPMATALPDSAFVGVDLSEVEINEGRRVISDLGLSNIELQHRNITDISRDSGLFDYIICHGVYSWVPSGVQEKILQICKENLSRDGVAYVSYNTYPGWHLSGMIREMLNFHADQIREPRTRIDQARYFLELLRKAVDDRNTPYSALLTSELDKFAGFSDCYLYHEHLGDLNAPIYFYQFAEKAASHGLKYLAEADVRSMIPANLNPEVAEILQMLTDDLIRMEQYMDFIHNRPFRRTLLCHEDQQPNYKLKPEVIRQFHIASPANCKSTRPNINSREMELFEGRPGVRLSTPDPIVKAAMICLQMNWPKAMQFDDLFRQARDQLTSPANCEDDDRLILLQTLLKCYASAPNNLIELHTYLPEFTVEISNNPKATPLARRQAAARSSVTNLRHENVMLSEVSRFLLQRLDGTIDLDELERAITDATQRGEISNESSDERPNQPEGESGRSICDNIAQIAGEALLVT